MDPSRVIGMGLYSQSKSIENEIARLRSFSQVFKVIQHLDFEVSYFEDKGMIRRELYHEAPFKIVFDTAFPQAIGLTYTITLLSPNEYLLEAGGEFVRMYNYNEAKYVGNKAENFVINESYAFGKQISTPHNTFKVILNDKFRPKSHVSKSYEFVFKDYFSLTGAFRGFTVSPIGEGSSILSIKMRSKNARKAVSFLNTLTNVYLNQSLEKKNQIVENTIDFIESQLQVTSDSVLKAAENLQEYQASNKIMNISFETEQILQQSSELEKEKAVLFVTATYYKNLESYVKSNLDQPESLIAPSSMGIEDPVLGSLFSALLGFYGERLLGRIAVFDRK